MDTYTVLEGDTSQSIADANKIVNDRLLAENGLDRDCERLGEGIMLCLGKLYQLRTVCRRHLQECFDWQSFRTDAAYLYLLESVNFLDVALLCNANPHEKNSPRKWSGDWKSGEWTEPSGALFRPQRLKKEGAGAG